MERIRQLGHDSRNGKDFITITKGGKWNKHAFSGRPAVPMAGLRLKVPEDPVHEVLVRIVNPDVPDDLIPDSFRSSPASTESFEVVHRPWSSHFPEGVAGTRFWIA